MEDLTADVAHIWNQFHKELRGFIAKKIRNPADTDDILQEVFVKIIRHADKIKQAENMRSYLYGMVRNAVNTYFQQRQSQHLHTDTAIVADISASEADTLKTTIGECCVRPFIQQLPEKYKEALLLAEFQGVSQKDMAEQLQISYSGAKSRVQRGREMLKDRILNCCAYESDRYGNLIESECRDKSCGCK